MNETITQRLDNHESRITALEAQSTEATESKKPWFLMKGVLGPLASGAATIALVVGYIMNWPADVMAALAALAGGGSVTGIIGRLDRERRATVAGVSAAKVVAVGALAVSALLLAPTPTAVAMSRVYEQQTTYYDDQGRATHTVVEQVTKKILEARERRESFKALADQRASQTEILARALPPAIENPEQLDPQAQRDYMAWGRNAGYVASNIRMAEALDPETTSALQAGKEIELAHVNKGLNWARVILGTPGGAVLIDRGFDWLQGVDPGEGDWGGAGEGGIVFSNIGHRVKDGGRDGGSGGGSGATDDLAGVGGSGGATETGVNDSPINITINNRSANQQAWDSTYSPVLEWAHDNGFTSPVVGEGGTLAPSSVEERGGATVSASTALAERNRSTQDAIRRAWARVRADTAFRTRTRCASTASTVRCRESDHLENHAEST